MGRHLLIDRIQHSPAGKEQEGTATGGTHQIIHVERNLARIFLGLRAHSIDRCGHVLEAWHVEPGMTLVVKGVWEDRLNNGCIRQTNALAKIVKGSILRSVCSHGG